MANSSIEITTGSGGGGDTLAWCNWNGTGTVAIRQSVGVSSITDNGTGLYTVNFSPALPNATYCFTFGNVLAGATDNVLKGRLVPSTTILGTSNVGTTNADAAYCCVLITGEA